MHEFLGVALLLGAIALLVLGTIGLINPAWMGFRTRARSSLVYFGTFLPCLVFSVYLSPGTENNPDAAETDRNYLPLWSLIGEYSSMTTMQRNEWSRQNNWKYWVEGRCFVADVSSTTWISEITEAEFEVGCETFSGDQVILFYPKTREQEVRELQRGAPIVFQGRLKTIRDWGFWLSGYVLIE